MRKVLAAAASAALLSVFGVGVAHAQFSGEIWEDWTANSATPPGPTASPPSSTFTATSINFNPTDTSSIYTIASWLASGGSGGTLLSNPSIGGDTMDNTFIEITGTVGLQAGSNAFVLAHDDGVVLDIAGIGTVLNASGPTSESFSPFNVTAPTTGNYAFTLYYNECCGPPATLQWAINNVTVGGVPEPATWAMMIGGIALVGAGLRSRRKVVLAAV